MVGMAVTGPISCRHFVHTIFSSVRRLQRRSTSSDMRELSEVWARNGRTIWPVIQTPT
jgi:hypothetical protein